MKKICFLSLMLIVAHGIASAQFSFDVNAGSGLWTATCDKTSIRDKQVISPNFTPTAYAGLSLGNTFKSGVVLSLGADFHFLSANGSYKTLVSSDDYLEKNRYMVVEWRDSDGNNYGHSYGDSEAAANYLLIAVPLRIGYQIGKFTPNIGMEYNYRISTDDNVSNMNTFGVTAGLQYKLTERLALTCNYYYGLSTDVRAQGGYKVYDTSNDADWKLVFGSSETYAWRTHRLDVGISYRLGKSE